jgi:hypothetical protein
MSLLRRKNDSSTVSSKRRIHIAPHATTDGRTSFLLQRCMGCTGQQFDMASSNYNGPTRPGMTCSERWGGATPSLAVSGRDD